jgi:hypothetical protein
LVHSRFSPQDLSGNSPRQTPNTTQTGLGDPQVESESVTKPDLLASLTPPYDNVISENPIAYVNVISDNPIAYVNVISENPIAYVNVISENPIAYVNVISGNRIA